MNEQTPPNNSFEFGTEVELIEKDTKIIAEEAEKDLKMAGRGIKEYWKDLGPGLTTGASDDDPSGIATYSQAGAQYGFHLAWLSIVTFPLMGVVQETCARIGMVTGRGLASNIKTHYSKWVLYICTFLLIVANTFNIGADLGAISEGARLIFSELPFSLLVIFFGVGSLLLQIFISYSKYARYLKYLSFILFVYVLATFYAEVNWHDVLQHTFKPDFELDKGFLILICGVFGTTISPYLFFWQPSQEVEDRRLKNKENLPVSRWDIIDMRLDTWSGIFISNLAMFFIIVLCGATLYSHGITNINTAADAANALRPFAGNFAYVLFALGILGTGLLAVPVLAGSAAYAVSESFNWKNGLNWKLKEARAFYGVISLAVLVGIILNFIGLDPIKALIYSAVLNGIISPVMLYFIVRLAGRKDIMGEHRSGVVSSVLGWLTLAIMTVVAIGAIYSIL